MRGKFLFGFGLLIGYIFGTRAGRKRYEQLKSFAQTVWNTEPVQHSVDTAKSFALSSTGDAADAALDAIKKLVRIATKGVERATDVAEDVVSETVDAATEAVERGRRSTASKSAPSARKSSAKA